MFSWRGVAQRALKELVAGLLVHNTRMGECLIMYLSWSVPAHSRDTVEGYSLFSGCSLLLIVVHH